jgi:hypothetical protein
MLAGAWRNKLTIFGLEIGEKAPDMACNLLYLFLLCILFQLLLNYLASQICLQFNEFIHVCRNFKILFPPPHLQ